MGLRQEVFVTAQDEGHTCRLDGRCEGLSGGENNKMKSWLFEKMKLTNF